MVLVDEVELDDHAEILRFAVTLEAALPLRGGEPPLRTNRDVRHLVLLQGRRRHGRPVADHVFEDVADVASVPGVVEIRSAVEARTHALHVS